MACYQIIGHAHDSSTKNKTLIFSLVPPLSNLINNRAVLLRSKLITRYASMCHMSFFLFLSNASRYSMSSRLRFSSSSICAARGLLLP